MALVWVQFTRWYPRHSSSALHRLDSLPVRDFGRNGKLWLKQFDGTMVESHWRLHR